MITILATIHAKRYKLMISVLFGLLGFAVNCILLISYHEDTVKVLVGMVFPLIISVTCGLKYGLISGLLSCQAFWLLLSMQADGILYSFPMSLLWVVWHGLQSDNRRKIKSVKWYHSIYGAEIVFWVVIALWHFIIFYVFDLQGLSFWNSSMSYEFSFLNACKILIKQIAFSLIFLLLMDLLLRNEHIGKFFRVNHKHNQGQYIIVASILMGFLIIAVDALGCTLFSTQNQLGFFDHFFNFNIKHVFIRVTALIVCAIFGIIIYRSYTRDNLQRKVIEQAYKDIQVKNDILITAQNKLLINDNKLRTYLNKAPYGVFITDENGTYVELNTEAENITGYSEEELVGMSHFDLLQENYRKKMHLYLKIMKQKDKGVVSEGMSNFVTKAGEVRQWNIKAIKLEETRFLVFAEDVTEKQQYKKRVDYLAKYDTLTGLHNKGYMNIYIDEIMNDTQHLPVSIIYSDINGMRRMNDDYGFAYGDKVIIKHANMLERVFGHKGTVCRMGGDSFSVVLPNTDMSECYRLVDILKDEIEKGSNDNLSYSAAIGCATHESNEYSWELSDRLAEDRMYSSKILNKDSLRSLVMNSFMKALYERSFETEEHVQRMKIVAEKIARKMGFNQYEINQVLLAAQFHDIGKIGVPDNILFKPGKLTDEEWTVMKRHSEIGQRIVSAASDMVSIGNIVLSHHERWDGKGYPNGLKGAQIPLEARIIAVADAFDAMTNNRVYRAKMSDVDAMKEISRCRGTQFDPNVVYAFLSCELTD